MGTSLEELKEMSVNELIKNVDSYSSFSQELSSHDLVNSALDFFTNPQGNYQKEVVDLCIAVSCRALNMNAKIYLKSGDNMDVLPLLYGKDKNRYLHLLYHATGFSQSEHYDALVINQEHTNYNQDRHASTSRQLILSELLAPEASQDSVPSKCKPKAAPYNPQTTSDIKKTRMYTTKIRINEKSYTDQEINEVQHVPYELNGKCMFIIRGVNETEWKDRHQDGRYFDLSDTKQKVGTRRTGYCLGQNICKNIDCKFLAQYGVENMWQHHGSKFDRRCSYCKEKMDNVICLAAKVLYYHPVEQILRVYHEGEHKCQLNPRRPDGDYIGKCVMERSDLGAAELCLQNIINAFRVQDMEGAEYAASHLQDREKISTMKRQLTSSAEDMTDSFAKMDRFQRFCRQKDPYWLWKFNKRECNGQETFAFRSNRYFIFFTNILHTLKPFSCLTFSSNVIFNFQIYA